MTSEIALICVAIMVLATTWLQLFEALFVFLFMIMTAPIGAHLIGRAAFRTRAPMDPRTRIDPDCDRFRPSNRSDVTPTADPAP
jgi:multicomponent Na+:H+ antiporter subunit G